MRPIVGARGFIAIGVALSLFAAGLAAAALSNRQRPASSASSPAGSGASASATGTATALAAGTFEPGAVNGTNPPQTSPTALASGTPASVSASASGAPTGSPQATSPSPTSAFTPTETPVPTNPPPLPGSQPSLPVRAAFYYPWFPEAWNQQGLNPFTHYNPSLGWYDSSASATIHAHIGAMQYAGIQVAISSWWGVGTRSDTRIPTILANTAGSTFR